MTDVQSWRAHGRVTTSERIDAAACDRQPDSYITVSLFLATSRRRNSRFTLNLHTQGSPPMRMDGPTNSTSYYEFSLKK